jgi:hypothetical protein
MTSVICPNMSIVSKTKEIRTSRLRTVGQGVDGAMDNEFEEWDEWYEGSEGVRSSPDECAGFRRYADYRKSQEGTGKGTEVEGRFGNG